MRKKYCALQENMAGKHTDSKLRLWLVSQGDRSELTSVMLG